MFRETVKSMKDRERKREESDWKEVLRVAFWVTEISARADNGKVSKHLIYTSI